MAYFVREHSNIFLWSLCISFVIALTSAMDPHGSTGCIVSVDFPDGNCWRYCAGNGHLWCYTERGCANSHSVCVNKIKCNGKPCPERSDHSCVPDCTYNTIADNIQYSDRPIGSTACEAGIKNQSRCWRYCHKTFGDWCYTNDDHHCVGIEDICAYSIACSSNASCEGERAGCVTRCKTRTIDGYAIQTDAGTTEFAATTSDPIPPPRYSFISFSVIQNISCIVVLIGLVINIWALVVILKVRNAQNAQNNREFYPLREVQQLERGEREN